MERILKKDARPRELKFEGEKGKSIFFRPLIGIISKQDETEFQRSMDKIWSSLSSESSKDERLVVLVGALLVENAVDEILDSIFYDYSSLRGKKDFSFSVRIEITRSLGLLPSRFLNSADVVRKIRNEFVHNLSCNTFSKLPKNELIESMKGHLTNFDNNFDFSKGNSETFKALVAYVFLGLIVYKKHVSWLNRFIRSSDFAPVLIAFVKQQKEIKKPMKKEEK